MNQDPKLEIYYRTRDPVTHEVALHTATDKTASFFWGHRPIIVMLPGMRVNAQLPGEWEKSASGYMKGIEGMLDRQKIDPDSVDIFSLAYSAHVNESVLADYMFGKRESFSNSHPTDEEQIVERVLLPVMGVRNPNEPLPTADQACWNLSRLTLISHSLGGSVARHVCDAFGKKLQTLGYAPADTERIQRSVVHIGLAAGIRHDIPSGFSTVAFSPRYDRRLWQLLQEQKDTLGQEHTPEQCYASMGLDPALLKRMLPQLSEKNATSGTECYTPRSDTVSMKSFPGGYFLTADVPNYNHPPSAYTQDPALHKPTNAEHVYNSFCTLVQNDQGKVVNGPFIHRIAATLGNSVHRRPSLNAQRQLGAIVKESSGRETAH